MLINLIDDYQANKKPTQTMRPYSANGIATILVDEYLAGNYNVDDLYLKYNPLIYSDVLFILNIEDDFPKANDEYVLITEDGFVISLEDYENQDEIAIIVR